MAKIDSPEFPSVGARARFRSRFAPHHADGEVCAIIDEGTLGWRIRFDLSVLLSPIWVEASELSPLPAAPTDPDLAARVAAPREPTND